MDTGYTDCIKHRDILFSELHAEDEVPARTAMLLLADVAGILNLQPLSDVRLQVSYDLRMISLHAIETALIEVGFHLDNNLLSKLRRALYHYTEETQCLNMGCIYDSKTTRDIFIDRYQRLQHGCRDERPVCWRKYL